MIMFTFIKHSNTIRLGQRSRKSHNVNFLLKLLSAWIMKGTGAFDGIALCMTSLYWLSWSFLIVKCFHTIKLFITHFHDCVLSLIYNFLVLYLCYIKFHSYFVMIPPQNFGVFWQPQVCGWNNCCCIRSVTMHS